jgi:hypothetical protein
MGIIASTAQQGYAQELKSIAGRMRMEGYYGLLPTLAAFCVRRCLQLADYS